MKTTIKELRSLVSKILAEEPEMKTNPGSPMGKVKAVQPTSSPGTNPGKAEAEIAKVFASAVNSSLMDRVIQQRIVGILKTSLGQEVAELTSDPSRLQQAASEINEKLKAELTPHMVMQILKKLR